MTNRGQEGKLYACKGNTRKELLHLPHKSLAKDLDRLARG